MRGFTKKIVSLALVLTLVVGAATTTMAAKWGEYIGADQGWEVEVGGASGVVSKNTDKAFTVKLDAVGFGGVWSCRMFQKVKVVKGKSYNISFKAKSEKLNKYIFVKIATKDVFAKGFWVKLPKGKTVKVSETFKAAANADEINIGLGGEGYDRSAEDGDGKQRYQMFEKQYKISHTQLPKLDCNGEFTGSTNVLSVSDFSFVSAPGKTTLKKVKALGKKKVKVTWKKTANAAGYQVQVGKVKKTTSKTSLKVKAKKKGKVSVKVRAYAKGKACYGAWSKAKKVKVK